MLGIIRIVLGFALIAASFLLALPAIAAFILAICIWPPSAAAMMRGVSIWAREAASEAKPEKMN